MKINIYTTFQDELELAEALKKVARMIEEGFTSGAGFINWELERV